MYTGGFQFKMKQFLKIFLLIQISSSDYTPLCCKMRIIRQQSENGSLEDVPLMFQKCMNMIKIDLRNIGIRKVPREILSYSTESREINLREALKNCTFGDICSIWITLSPSGEPLFLKTFFKIPFLGHSLKLKFIREGFKKWLNKNKV